MNAEHAEFFVVNEIAVEESDRIARQTPKETDPTSGRSDFDRIPLSGTDRNLSPALR